MSVNFYDLEEISNGNYAKFYNTNLHVHTPSTPWDWNSFNNQTVSANEITPKIFFDKLNETSLDLIAITDHNTVKWCKPLIELAIDSRKRGESNIHILPGVEITSYEGPHIIGLFEEDPLIVVEINNLLIRLGLTGEGSENEIVGKSGFQDITIKTIINEIIKLGGLVVAPHIHSNLGLWGNKDFRGRNEILKNSELRILAAPSGEIKIINSEDGVTKLLFKNMDSEKYKNSYAFINISDCHRIEDLEKDTTWIKMCQPNLEGLKQIIFEPELRVCHSEVKTKHNNTESIRFEFCSPTQEEYPIILGFIVNGGMFEKEVIKFSPNLNSVIGKNYAGKTAILDMVRFVLNIFPKEDSTDKNIFISRLKGILEEGGYVDLYAKTSEGSIYGFSRTLVTDDDQILSEPEVYRLIGKTFEKQSERDLKEIFIIEDYPQGKVVKIKSQIADQLDIIDLIGNLTEKYKRIYPSNSQSLYDQIIEINNQIVFLESSIYDLEQEIQTKVNLQKELSDLDDVISSDDFLTWRKWGAVKEKINSYKERINEFEKPINSLIEKSNQKEISKSDNETNPEIKSLAFTKYSVDDFQNELEKKIDSQIELMGSEIRLLNDRKSQINNFLIEVENICAQKHNTVEEQIKSTSDGEISSIFQRYDSKKSRLSQLISKEKEMEKFKIDLEDKNKQRGNKLEEFKELRKELSKEREEIVSQINKSCSQKIRTELFIEDDYSNFLSFLKELVKNLTSRDKKIQNIDKQLNLVCKNLRPSEFLSLLRQGNLDDLINKTNISQNTASILMGMDRESILSLELCINNDKFIISYKREGDAYYTPIDSGLSGGEQALALLSVALVPKQMPLIIDQPEDELGTSLISNDLVNQIRKVKNDRQLIFVTHVANIPVQGDSEQIIYIAQNFQNDKRLSRVDCDGSLDQKNIITKLLDLDGGPIAFKKRASRYLPVISD